MKITTIEPFVGGAPTPGNGKLSNKNDILGKSLGVPVYKIFWWPVPGQDPGSIVVR
jgi:hypothetical protein